MQATTFASRPLSTDDAGIVGSGKIEMEVSYDFVRGIGDEDNVHEAGIWLGHGITDKFDLEVTLPYFISPLHGLDTLEIGAKLAFLFETETLPGFSMTLFINPGEKNYIINGIMSKAIGSFAGHFNLGYEATGISEEKGSYTYALAGEYNVTESIAFAGEVSGSTGEDFIHHDVNVLAGARYGVIEWLSVDVGIKINLSDESYPINVTTGLSFKL